MYRPLMLHWLSLKFYILFLKMIRVKSTCNFTHKFDKFLYKFSPNITQLVWHQGKLLKSLPDIPLPFIFLIMKVLKRHWTICLNPPEKSEKLIKKKLKQRTFGFQPDLLKWNTCTHRHHWPLFIKINNKYSSHIYCFCFCSYINYREWIARLLSHSFSLYYHGITVIKPVHITSAITWNEMQGSEFMPSSKVFSGN